MTMHIWAGGRFIPYSRTCRRRRGRDKEAPTWRERRAALCYVPPFICLIWHSHRGYTCAMIGLRLLRACIAVAALWIGKLIIDAVVAAQGAARDLSQLWMLVALEFAIVLIGDRLARTSALVESLLGDLFSNYMSVRLLEHAATFDLFDLPSNAPATASPTLLSVMHRSRPRDRHIMGRLRLVEKQCRVAGLMRLTCKSITFIVLALTYWLECKC
jgi:hypothetical protein